MISNYNKLLNILFFPKKKRITKKFIIYILQIVNNNIEQL